MAMYSLGHPKSRSVILKYSFHVLTHLKNVNVLTDPVPGTVNVNSQFTYIFQIGLKLCSRSLWIKNSNS